MTIGGYDAFNDPYKYKGSPCLKNRLGLRDPTRLAAFELEISTLRSDEPLPSGRFGPTHYRKIHWHLFRDVYAWAGRYRSVRTAKGGNWFCYPEYIATAMDTLFARLSEKDWLPGSTESDFLDALTDFLAELNAIHPFREGNGRTQLAFVDLLAFRAGWPLNLTGLHPESFLEAMIASFAGDVAALRQQLGALRP